jgi:hypothetical protein
MKKKSHPEGASELVPVSKKPVTSDPIDQREGPAMHHSHNTANRAEIRATTKRVMGSRQSERKVERTDQRRQPKRGRTKKD